MKNNTNTTTLEIVRQTDDGQAWWCLRNKKVCVLTDDEIYDIIHANDLPNNNANMHRLKHASIIRQKIEKMTDTANKTVPFENGYAEYQYEFNHTTDFISAITKRIEQEPQTTY